MTQVSPGGDAHVTIDEPARAVERAVELLLRVAGNPGSTSLQELTNLSGYSKSTTHRLLTRLLRLEVVERDPESRRFRVGRRLVEVLGVASSEVDGRRIALPYMEALRSECIETVSLHLLDTDDEVVIESLEGLPAVRFVIQIGQRRPLRRGATAKAILAFLPPEQARAILARTCPPGVRGPSMQELKRVRRAGFGLSVSELVPDAVALSAPIFDRQGRVWAGVSLSGPAYRFTEAIARHRAPSLTRAAALISRGLGCPQYVDPAP